MVKPSTEIINEIKVFANKVINNNINIQELYLFGSFALGTSDTNSDIDIAILSNDFQGVSFLDYDKLIRALYESDNRIEPHTFKTDDAYLDPFFISEIKSKGIRIL